MGAIARLLLTPLPSLETTSYLRSTCLSTSSSVLLLPLACWTQSSLSDAYAAMPWQCFQLYLPGHSCFDSCTALQKRPVWLLDCYRAHRHWQNVRISACRTRHPGYWPPCLPQLSLGKTCSLLVLLHRSLVCVNGRVALMPQYTMYNP